MNVLLKIHFLRKNKIIFYYLNFSLEFIINKYKNYEVTKELDFGAIVKCKNKTFLIEIAISSSQMNYFDCEDKVCKIPTLLFVYNGKTGKSIEEIDLTPIIENLVKSYTKNH